jgi:hypothetical protein
MAYQHENDDINDRQQNGHIINEAAYERAVHGRIIANAQKTWRLNTPRHQEIEDAIMSGRGQSDRYTTYSEDFIGNMAKAFDTWGKLTENQSAAILKGIDFRTARKAEWADKKAQEGAQKEFVGVVGEKITLYLTVRHIVDLEGAYGWSGIFICTDQHNNTIIYKGTSGCMPAKGQNVRITATVKEHGVREGVKQTVIQRPKLAKEGS